MVMRRVYIEVIDYENSDEETKEELDILQKLLLEDRKDPEAIQDIVNKILGDADVYSDNGMVIPLTRDYKVNEDLNNVYLCDYFGTPRTFGVERRLPGDGPFIRLTRYTWASP